eukprot:2600063-Rhodomonas_salina.2
MEREGGRERGEERERERERDIQTERKTDRETENQRDGHTTRQTDRQERGRATRHCSAVQRSFGSRFRRQWMKFFACSSRHQTHAPTSLVHAVLKARLIVFDFAVSRATQSNAGFRTPGTRVPRTVVYGLVSDFAGFHAAMFLVHVALRRVCVVLRTKSMYPDAIG